jgi:hypothetical protein
MSSKHITTIRQHIGVKDKNNVVHTEVHVNGTLYTYIEHHKEANVCSVELLDENKNTVKDIEIIEAISNHLDSAH